MIDRDSHRTDPPGSSDRSRDAEKVVSSHSLSHTAKRDVRREIRPPSNFKALRSQRSN